MLINDKLIVTARFWVSLPLGILADWKIVALWMICYGTFEGLDALAFCRYLKSHKEQRDKMFPDESSDAHGAFLNLPMTLSFGVARFFGGCAWIALIAAIGWLIRLAYDHLFA
jgi:hypothetical protein